MTSPVLADGVADYTPGVSRDAGGTTTFAHAGLKNTNSQSAENESIAASRVYDAFGNVVSSSGTWSGPFGYAGDFGYQEDESEYKSCGARYLDSQTGRFLTSDTAGWGSNWYTYCEGHVLTYIDADGLKKKLIILILSLGKLGDKSKVGGDTRPFYPGLAAGPDESYGGEYDITTVHAYSRAGAMAALLDVDAFAIVGHGGPPELPGGRLVDDKFLAQLAQERLAHGHGRTDFARVYSCGTMTDDKTIGHWLLVTKQVYGYAETCWFSETMDDIDAGGQWWRGRASDYLIPPN